MTANEVADRPIHFGRERNDNTTVKRKHIIWDWNGTLFDDAWLAVDILNHVRERRGMTTVSLTWYRNEFVTPVREFYRRMGFDLTSDPYEKLSGEWFKEYEARRFECRLQRDAESVIRTCAEAGIAQSVLSMYPQRSLEDLIRHFDMSRYFVNAVGLNDHFADSKVDLGRALLVELEDAPADMILVGDTEHDREVADALGLECVLVPQGHQSRTKLEAPNSTLINTLRDLLPLVL